MNIRNEKTTNHEIDNAIHTIHIVCCQPCVASLALTASAQNIPLAISTPDKVETRLGTLEFKDGAPSKETVDKVYDNLDLMHGVEAFVNAFQGASTSAIRRGLNSAGVEDNTAIIFSEMMDSKSLFLTCNADTIHFWAVLDASKGPIVVETPPLALGTIDDMWFRWVTDFGLPGPDRGTGGKFLLLPPGYKGDLPDSGYSVVRMRTTRAIMLGREFLEDNDPKRPVALIKKTLKIYPYQPGGFGTSIATGLEGKVPLLRSADGKLDWAFLRPQPPGKFVEGSGKVMNTVPPNDFSYFEMINELVQMEPADALDPEIMGSLAATGIVKGKPFNPDARMRKILTEAAAIGTATGRTLNWNARESDFYYYPGSAWVNYLFVGGYTMETPPPQVSPAGVVTPYPPTGYRTLNARTAMFFYATGITSAMIMRLTDISSQYLGAFVDSKGDYLDGGKTYKVTLPPNIPAAKFWSFTVYDNQARSMLQTPQRYPRAGSQSYPTPAAVANPDGGRPCISVQPNPAALARAIGSRQRRARVGTLFSASIARLSPSSRSSGGRVRSNWSSNSEDTAEVKIGRQSAIQPISEGNMATNSQDKGQFNINEHFTELMNSVGLDPSDTGGTITFVGEDPIMESRIRLGAAYSIPYMGTAAAAAMIWKMRTGRGQDLKIDLRKAIHCIADMPWSTLNGRPYPAPYLKGCYLKETIYQTKDGRHFVPVGFYPEMERAWCDFLVCTPLERSIAAKIAQWNALDLETECNSRGLVGGMVRTIEEWANTECGQQLAQTPVIEITKIGDSDPESFQPGADRPLSGLRVVCNTHEIAGTAVGRTLAEQGAEAIQTTSPDEYFHEPVFLEAGVGFRQAYVNIKNPAELEVMYNLLGGADVFVENFRHMGENGLSPETVASLRPGIIYVSAHGITHHGPWAERGCFDPLAIPLTGIAALEGTLDAPTYPPFGLLNDVLSGIFGTLGAYAALLRRAKEGGSYHVRVTLCRCSMWYGTLGYFDRGNVKQDGEQHKLIEPDMFEADTPLGLLRRPAPCVEFSETKGYWADPVLRYRGSDKPEWRK